MNRPASRFDEVDLGSEYGRLLAQRDRLIAAGVDPDELEVPLAPLDPDPLHVDEELTAEQWIDIATREPEFYDRPRPSRAVLGRVLVSLAVVGLSLLAVWLLLGAQWRNDEAQRDAGTVRGASDSASRVVGLHSWDVGVGRDALGHGAERRGPDDRGSGTTRPGPARGGTGEAPAAPPLTSGLPDTASVERGTATWCAPTPTHCQSWGGGAKLGAVQSFRYGDEPYRVKVCRVGGACTTVTVVSFCACANTLIDLSPASFKRLAPLSRGRIHVTVERTGSSRLPFLPPTDTVE